jgi:hypothetical protein
LGQTLGKICCLVGLVLLAMPLTAVAAPVATPQTGTPFDPKNFVKTVDNPYSPLTPGTRFVYEGSKDGAPLRVETTVTTESKRILGVDCVVVRDVAFEDGEIVEDTLDWYAQDQEGSVWYFGEDSKTIEHGKVTSTEGSWEAGVQDAQPGIIMPGSPMVDKPYQQEFAPGIAEDMAQVIKLGETVSVKYGTFDKVLVTREWSPLDPGIAEEKSYAPGVGLIRAVSVEGEDERMELIDIQQVQATPAASPAA